MRWEMSAISRMPSWSKSSVYTFCHEEGLVLLYQRVLRLREDPEKIVLREGAELDPDGEPALKLGYEVGRLGHVEGPGSDEEYMVRLYHAVLRRDGRALDDGQDVALNPFPGDIGPVGLVAARDLVYLVEEDDPCLLHPVDRVVHDPVHIDELLRFLLDQVLVGLADLHLPSLRFLGKDVPEHVPKLHIHLLHALGGKNLDDGKTALGHLYLDELVIELPIFEETPHLLSGQLV